ncbi:MAG: hypothetical protein E3K37_00315 [Candidatus Kuenenia sp.]|nr:hypothetical protein [Candidatus Kuenenia hertensis]
MDKIRILLMLFYVAIQFLCVLAYFTDCKGGGKNDNAGKGHTIQWFSEKITIDAECGEAFLIETEFESTLSLSNISVCVVPELEPFLSATPSDFETINPGYRNYC